MPILLMHSHGAMLCCLVRLVLVSVGAPCEHKGWHPDHTEPDDDAATRAESLHPLSCTQGGNQECVAIVQRRQL